MYCSCPFLGVSKAQSVPPKYHFYNSKIVLSAQDVPSEVKENVYEHVFNQMPIRVLAFDSQGTNHHLLERSAIASLVISRIQNVYPDGVDVNDGPRLAKEFSKYAILSHTWIRGTPGDIVYQEWESRELPIRSQGHSKIAKFCKIAASEYNVSFGWMDTVCINKDSSAELDESIRSMYKWYKLAHVCVAYLAEASQIADMHQDAWFTRSWTLQELLAPRVLRFYNRNWNPLVPHHSSTTASAVGDPDYQDDLNAFTGERHRAEIDNNIPLEIEEQIFKATSLTTNELDTFHQSPYRVPLSRIMELAARRRVTREEDKIYSLMGLLNVGITVAYGEGSHSAFGRIIREIMLSKPKFMDIFNHSNRYCVLPEDITDYTGRSSAFARTRSLLNLFTPAEPVLLTHLGVRLTLLAVPAFLKDIYGHRIPSEVTSQTFSLTYSGDSDRDYIILDDSDYSATWIANLVTLDDRDSRQWTVIYMAILSSSVDPEDGGFSLLASNALCIPMSPDRIGAHKLADIQPADKMSGPMSIPLPYSTPSDGGDVLLVARAQADKLGFRVITRYFT